MPFCYSPWTNIDISPQGKISPCCKFKHEHYPEPAIDINTDSIAQYINGPVLRDVKEQFKQGQWPAGCTRCQIEEENNIESKRMLDYTRWQPHYELYNIDSDRFITASVAFGNTCNLKCITCDPKSSSKWQSEYRQIYNVDILPSKFYKQDFVKEFAALAPSLVHLDIPGGEPFLSGVAEQRALLQQWIDSGQSKDITLHYTTNGTLWPDESWWKIWEQFKHIDMQISIDGVGKRYEYIRFPGKWVKLTSNVDRYLEQSLLLPNLQISVSHTVSAYNIYYLDEFFTWCNSVGLPRPWAGRVHNPIHMRPSVWNRTANDTIISHLKESTHPDVITWAALLENSDDSNQFEEFKTRLHQHDRARNLNFKLVFPELAHWV